MKNLELSILCVALLLFAALNMSVAQPALGQPTQLKGDIRQLAKDVREGMERSTLTDEQKAQLRDDFKELRRAHQNHEKFAALRAARSIRTVLDSGAFKPDDAQKIKQDLQAIREARGDRNAGFER